MRNIKAWPTPRVKKKVVSAKEAKIKIFTISFDVLSIEKCILCDKVAKQQNRNARITTSGGTDKRPASSFFFTPQSGKNFACLLKDDDVNDATHVLPLPVAAMSTKKVH